MEISIESRRWCIYRITNKVDEKTYIGQHRYHKDNSNNPMGGYYGSGKIMLNALIKYTKYNLIREILAQDIKTQEEANLQEISFIAKEKEADKAEYNIELGGAGNCDKVVYLLSTEEVRNKISNSLRGKKQTQQAKERRAESLKKYWDSLTPEQRKGRAKAETFKGHKVTDETREKISKILREGYASGKIKTTKGYKRPGAKNKTTFKKGNKSWNVGISTPRKPGVTEQILNTKERLKKENPEKFEEYRRTSMERTKRLQTEKSDLFKKLVKSGKFIGSWNEFQKYYKGKEELWN